MDSLAVVGLTVIVVNDGSDAPTSDLLEQLSGRHDFLELVVRKANGGKGAAVKTGLRKADSLGFSHALQVDADGQHDPGEIPAFLRESEAYPESLILGHPNFGEDVPRARLYGRQLSRIMVWMQTLSLQIADPLFGFRVYPVKAAMRLMDRVSLGNRMDFDPEIAVRLYWQGVNVRNMKAKVHYPEDGVSHFQVIHDNLRLSWLHTRLLLGMLLRAPKLLVRHWR